MDQKHIRGLQIDWRVKLSSIMDPQVKNIHVIASQNPLAIHYKYFSLPTSNLVISRFQFKIFSLAISYNFQFG